MPFNKQIDEIGAIRIIIDSADAVTPFSGRIIIQGLAQDIEIGKKDFDLINNLTQAQINSIANFVGQMRAKAIAEIL